ncbi:MAG: DUF4430 domain-containing protein [Candidatus Aenigmarchaeota archaeon]|nr:DUF4430 domain-containing protein [Candidatus Aenigmarchaeota archaeon]NIQ18051.1 DUF4430 domain-containing protein [Candidatus Aenigmarchaeota archaeon]
MESRSLLIAIILIAVMLFAGFQIVNLTGFFVLGTTRTVELNIDNGIERLTYTYDVGEGETAFDALKRVAVIDYEMYSTGIIVSEINGVKMDENHHWLCLVNGKLPEKPCDFYEPDEGDVISFVYLTSEEALNYFI